MSTAAPFLKRCAIISASRSEAFLRVMRHTFTPAVSKRDSQDSLVERRSKEAKDGGWRALDFSSEQYLSTLRPKTSKELCDIIGRQHLREDFGHENCEEPVEPSALNLQAPELSVRDSPSAKQTQVPRYGHKCPFDKLQTCSRSVLIVHVWPMIFSGCSWR